MGKKKKKEEVKPNIEKIVTTKERQETAEELRFRTIIEARKKK